MKRLGLADPGLFSRVVVGWDVEGATFTITAHRPAADEQRPAEQPAWIAHLPSMDEVDAALASLQLTLVPEIRAYLLAACADDIEELRRLEPLVRGYQET